MAAGVRAQTPYRGVARNSTWVGRVVHFEEIDSTNTWVCEVRGWRRDTVSVVVADRQRAGRGQRHNTFFSSLDGGLWATLVVAVDELENHFRVNRSLALAICDVLEEVCTGVQATVKWPNDILLNGRKVCGILLESFWDKGWFIAAGFGINIAFRREDFPPDIRETATSVFHETGVCPHRERVLDLVLRQMERRMNEEPQSAHEAWSRKLVGVGRCAVIGTSRGIFTGADAKGRAELACEGNETLHTSGPFRLIEGVPYPAQGGESAAADS